MSISAPPPHPTGETPAYVIEAVAKSAMSAAVTFLLLQVLVMAAVVIAWGTLSQTLHLPGPVVEQICLAFGLALETVIVFFLVRSVGRVATRARLAVAASPTIAQEDSDFERRLERMNLLAIVIAVGVAFGLGAAPSARVALIVVEGFAALFLLISIVTRWLLAGRVSLIAALALFLTVFSLVLAARPPAG